MATEKDDLDKFIEEEKEQDPEFKDEMEKSKPLCKLTGINGNVFSIISAVARALKNAGMKDKAEEFKKRAMSGDYDYNQILGKLVYEYVEVE